MSSENSEPVETPREKPVRRPAAGTPRKTTLRPPSWFMRLWLSCVAQYLFLITVAGVIGFSYFAGHRYWNDEYWSSISKIVNSCLGVYQIAPDSTGRRIELQHAGQPITSVAALPPAPFGIEKIAGVQAVLNRYATLARSTDLIYAQNEARFLGAFTAGERGVWILRVSWFPTLNGSRAEFHIDASDMSRLRGLKGPELQHFAASFLGRSRLRSAGIEGNSPAGSSSRRSRRRPVGARSRNDRCCSAFDHHSRRLACHVVGNSSARYDKRDPRLHRPTSFRGLRGR
ncbi:MAG: hypothetical protein QM760_03605 [Nibricoccus sp.]